MKKVQKGVNKRNLLQRSKSQIRHTHNHDSYWSYSVVEKQRIFSKIRNKTRMSTIVQNVGGASQSDKTTERQNE